MTSLPLHNDLYQELLASLKEVEQEPDPVKQAVVGVGICFQYLNKLKARFDKEPVTEKELEIQFFKEVKPFFLCWLIYYSELFRFFTRRQPISRQPYKKATRRLVRRMKKFYKRTADFYTYCRVGHTHLDDQYFLRIHVDWKRCVKPNGTFNDPSFSTNHDLTLARMLAYDELEKFVIRWQNAQPAKGQVSRKSRFTWTAAKTYLKEVALGFHLAGVLDHGKANISDIAMDLAEHYNISIDDMNQVIQQLKRLTKTNTPCLDDMRACITNRIEQSEEVSFHGR